MEPTVKVYSYEDVGLPEELSNSSYDAYNEETYLTRVLHYIERSNSSGDTDFSKPFIKHSLRYVYPLFILLHAIICIGGVAGNAAMLVVLRRRKLHRSPTFFFLANLAMSDILKAGLVLPISVASMLFANWIFGSFLCYFLPMMHSFPIHASMLTHTVMAVDRYRLILYPMKSRVPAGLCVIAVWVAGVCVVLPYAVYIKFIDLEAEFGPMFDGVGVCMVLMPKHIQEYIRATFVVMYCLPLAIMAFLYVRVSAEIKAAETPSVVMPFKETMNSISDDTYQTNVTWSSSGSHTDQRADDRNSFEDHSDLIHPHSPLRCPDPDDEDDIQVDFDFRKEKRTQKYLIAMVVLFAMCWCPVNILSLVNHFVFENEDNTGHFDVTFLTFTFFGFMSTCTNPILFASWCMSDQAKDRLRGYFRFSNRQRRHNQPRPAPEQQVQGSPNMAFSSMQALSPTLPSAKPSKKARLTPA